MSLETLIWSFPIVFILHDFEEIIMGPPWLRQNGEALARRFPRAGRLIAPLRELSAAGYAMAVLVMFALVLGVTGLTLGLGLYDFWAGAVLVFFLHFLGHCGQALAWRGYVPVILTSPPGALWCVLALWAMAGKGLLHAGPLLGWAVFGLVLTAIWFRLAFHLAGAFDRWLRRACPAAF